MTAWNQQRTRHCCRKLFHPRELYSKYLDFGDPWLFTPSQYHGVARLLSESIALAEAHGSTATLDGNFFRDFEAIINIATVSRSNRISTCYAENTCKTPEPTA
jgi:hypothetical protein